MDFITSTFLSGVLYDGFKHGITITAGFLKEKLQGWVVDDATLERLSHKVNSLSLQDFGEHVIERKLNQSQEIQEILKLIRSGQNTNIETVNQTHSGSGDNIVGNKTVNNK